HQVVLFEAEGRLGGHTNTVDVQLDGMEQAVDTGFLVYNEKTYPELIALFKQLEVPTAATDMSFSVSRGPHRMEWCGSDLSGLFAQKSHLLSPRFWGMLRDVLRFNRQATALAQTMLDAPPGQSHAFGHATLDQPLDAFLSREGYGEAFTADYLLPMAAAIWSCPMKQMREFPLGTFVRFFNNHGLLQVNNRPRWFTVAGGARQYVQKMAKHIDDVRLNTPVWSVEQRANPAGQLRLQSAAGDELFDAVVLACHSDQSLRMLKNPRPAQAQLLASIRYQENRAWLHCDSALMPRSRKAWAAWNYLSKQVRDDASQLDQTAVSVTYWLNRLQPLAIKTPLFVSLNPLQEPQAASCLQVIDYAHPVFDLAAVRAQRQLPSIQGADGVWLAGAWTAFGFHEDGLRSGLAVAKAIEQTPQVLGLAA
nr:NAD/FAD-binding protein [Betaproteobacteria bacterium]